MVALLEKTALNEEGFMLNPEEWTEEIAVSIAKKEAVTPFVRQFTHGDHEGRTAMVLSSRRNSY